MDQNMDKRINVNEHKPNKIKNIDCILFDADGTLIDTYDIILTSMRHTVNGILGKNFDDAKLMSLVGTPLLDQMTAFAGNPEDGQRLTALYRKHNDVIHDEGVKAFPKMKDALSKLAADGYKLGVVTSKRHFMAERGLEVTGIANFFEILIGSDDCEKHKPDPGPILYACDLMHTNPEKCVYVGDSPYDIQAGNSAGCTTVAVLWGMFPEAELLAMHPDFVCPDIDSLVKLFD